MDLQKVIQEYKSLQLDKVMDHQKFSEYKLTHHSTTIEGSTLTETDTQLLLDEGVTPKGKPLEHSLMVKDHHEALQYVLQQAAAKKPVTIELLQTIAGKVMKGTGRTYNTALGNIDASKGEFRKGNVSAGGTYFPSYDKVEKLTKQLVDHLQQKMKEKLSVNDTVELAHAAHFDLVSIHPFYDGNGRTSRLLMNYIQAYYNLPLGMVHKEDRASYFEALKETRKKEDIDIFQEFMKTQYKKMLQKEIDDFKQMKQESKLVTKKRNTNRKKPGQSLFL